MSKTKLAESPFTGQDLTGRTFGRLTVIALCGFRRCGIHREAKWKCLCTCGNYTVVGASGLKTGSSKSCGCLAIELTSKRNKTHGYATCPPHPMYQSWVHMKIRCNNKNDKRYASYGGRGIRICKRWMVFERFLDDMGQTWKLGLQIGRKDNNGNYCPENCAWENRFEQCNNRRNTRLLTVRGNTMTFAQWEKHLGLNGGLISSRIRRGFTPEDAIVRPL